MTPDLVAELLRQLMKEAMILSAPVLVAAVVLGFLLTLVPDDDQSAGAVTDFRSTPRCSGAHPACWHAVVSRAPCGLHTAADV